MIENFNFKNDSIRSGNTNNAIFADMPIKPGKPNTYDFITWADQIDWGNFNLAIDSDPNPKTVNHTFKSFVNAIRDEFDYLYGLINQTPAIAVTGVTVSPTTKSFTAVNETQQLTATVSPSNATNKNVTWTSSNTNIATVSSSGLVTAKANGTATITVKTVDGNKTATCAVTVAIPAQTIAVTGVTVSPATKLFTAANDTQQLTVTVAPSNATNKNVTYESSNTSVATVNSSGLITAIANGTANITVKTVDGNKTAACVVSVEIPAATNYYWYVGQDHPSAKNTIVTDNTAPGWRFTGTLLDADYEFNTTDNNIKDNPTRRATWYIALPVNTAYYIWDDQHTEKLNSYYETNETITFANVSYKVYKLEGTVARALGGILIKK